MTSERSAIDAWMPDYDHVERHRTRIAAPAATVYDALLALDLAASPIARLLIGLRSLPGWLAGRRPAIRLRRTLTLRDATQAGFVMLEERAPHAIVLGLTGRFWQLAGGVLPTDPHSFRDPPPPGAVRAAWSFELSPIGVGATELSTETRVRCADAAARRAFGRYWRIVRPGSGLLRRLMLRAVREAAERAAAQDRLDDEPTPGRIARLARGAPTGGAARRPRDAQPLDDEPAISAPASTTMPAMLVSAPATSQPSRAQTSSRVLAPAGSRTLTRLSWERQSGVGRPSSVARQPGDQPSASVAVVSALASTSRTWCSGRASVRRATAGASVAIPAAGSGQPGRCTTASSANVGDFQTV